MKTIIYTTLAALTLGAGINTAMAMDKAVFTPQAKVQFEDIIPGVVAFATVAGDRATGAHGTFVKIPAGKATPLHTHGDGYHAVVVEGILQNPVESSADSNQPLTKGSYYSVPANAKHVTKCADNNPTDCLSFFYQTKPFSFEVSK